MSVSFTETSAVQANRRDTQAAALTGKGAWKFSLAKREKKDAIQKIGQQILEMIEQKKEGCPLGALAGSAKEVCRFKIKTHEECLSFQWVLNLEGCNPAGGILSIERKAQLRSFAICASEEACKITDYVLKLFPLLNGNRFERISLLKMQALNISYFNSWEEEKKKYRQAIYPFCWEYASYLMTPNTTILELCGGDGEFANCLLEKEKTRIEKYFMIELNPTSYKKAEDALKSFDGKAEVIFDDVTLPNYTQKIKKVDLVIGIGALTEQIMPSREKALQALKLAASCMADNGAIVLTGLTSSWITSNDLEDLGLEVRNSVFPLRDIKSEDPEFYVAIKIKEPKKMWNFEPVSPSVIPLKTWWNGH